LVYLFQCKIIHHKLQSLTIQAIGRKNIACIPTTDGYQCSMKRQGFCCTFKSVRTANIYHKEYNHAKSLPETV